MEFGIVRLLVGHGRECDAELALEEIGLENDNDEDNARK